MTDSRGQKNVCWGLGSPLQHGKRKQGYSPRRVACNNVTTDPTCKTKVKKYDKIQNNPVINIPLKDTKKSSNKYL